MPWCSSRCGYCDFNTYVPGSLSTASPQQFAGDAIAELRLARRVLGVDREILVSTVFFGGGTPTLLPPHELTAILRAIDSEFGLEPDAEVTTEANPESVTPESLAALRAGGFNRISIGMQSAVPGVLLTLDRVHTPGRAAEAARWSREAGFAEVSLDLIYGAPGESDSDWARSIEAALAAEPSHVSAYSLIVEGATRMARMVASGAVRVTDEDVMAMRYELADSAFVDAGLGWYEVSNWARGGVGGGSECRHNLGYWRSDDWWGIGPGAHSHVGGTRWWNIKHPGSYAQALGASHSPVVGSESLSECDRRLEAVMLRLRLATGLPRDAVDPEADDELELMVRQGLLESNSYAAGHLVLTDRGRLLADLVIRRIT